MTAKIIDGRAISKEIRESLKEEIKTLNETPGLAAVLVGEDPASKLYVSFKQKACEEVGIYHELHKYPDTITREELLGLIKKLNDDPKIHGILVQLPLPKHINEQEILDNICPRKDVDGLGTYNMGRLMIGKPELEPATPSGVMQMLKHEGIEIEGKHAVVIGRSNIVGKPLALMLQRENATVTMCHSRSKPLEKYTKEADILCVAVGKPGLITADMVKEGAIVIDVGINRLETGKVVGDVDFESVKEKASYITPVPGGAGPMTITMLLKNTVQAVKLLEKGRTTDRK